MFIPCWKEVKQVMTLCEGKGNMSANKKEGLLRFRLREGEYRQDINIRIPYLYPEEGVEIEFLSSGSNFPTDIQNMYYSQAQEIVRRCVAGFLADHVTDVRFINLIIYFLMLFLRVQIVIILITIITITQWQQQQQHPHQHLKHQIHYLHQVYKISNIT